MRKPLETYYPETRFGGFTDIDGTIAFYQRVNALLREDFVVLDVGCGRGSCQDDPVPCRRHLRILRGKCRRVIGIDVDPVARTNPFIDEFRPIAEGPWPVGDQSIDLCVCDSVLEHIADPPAFLAQCARVIKPGGLLCLRTPNRLGYVALAASLIPAGLHAKVLRKAQPTRQQEDVFPTHYRCNTVGKLKRTLRQCGFDACVYGYDAEPMYLSFSRLAYAVGVVYAKLMPHQLKNTLFVFAARRAETEPPKPGGA